MSAGHETLIIELNKQKQSNEEQKQVIKGFEEKILILKIARMTEGKENNSDVRARINELVREIDKCIGLLNT